MKKSIFFLLVLLVLSNLLIANEGNNPVKGFLTFSPTNGAVEVPVNTTLTITFATAMPIVFTGDTSKHMYIYRSSDNMLVYTIDTSNITFPNWDRMSCDILEEAPLMPGTKYYITMDSNFIKDIMVWVYEGFHDSTTWSFTTAEDTNLHIRTFVPTQGARNVTIDINELASTLSMTFSDSVRIIPNLDHMPQNYLFIREKESDYAYGYFSNEQIQVQSDSITIKINLAKDKLDNLPFSTDFYINIDSNRVEDHEGNKYKGIYDKIAWTFTTRDPHPAPNAVVFYPESGDTNVYVERSYFSIKFDKAIMLNPFSKNGIHCYLNNASDSTNVLTWAAGDVSMEVYDSTLYLYVYEPDSIKFNHAYFINIDPAVVYDTSAESNYDGIHDATTWAFRTTSDSIPPTVETYYPAQDATNIPREVEFKLVFDEPIQFYSSLKKKLPSISLYRSLDSSLVFKWYAEVEQEGARINGDTLFLSFYQEPKWSPLENDSSYYFKISNYAIQDLHGNYYEGIDDYITWRFTVQPSDTVKPQVVSLYPEVGGVYYRLDSISMTFNEPIRKTTILKNTPFTYFLYMCDKKSGDTLDIAPLEWFEVVNDSILVFQVHKSKFVGPEYCFKMAAGLIEDQFGNKYDGLHDSSWSFFIYSDTIAPVVQSYTPVQGAVDVPITPEIMMVFSESIEFLEDEKSIGLFKIFLYEDQDSLIASFPLNINWFYISNDTLTFNPPSKDALPYNTKFYVNIDSIGIVDNSGNPYKGIYDSETWTFTTEIYVGVNETKKSTVNLFPNPSNGKITVSTQNKSEINIYSSLGKLVYHSVINKRNESIDVSNLGKGIYIVQLKDVTLSNSETMKLVIQ